MLNIKKLLTKVLTSKVGLAYVGNVYWWQNTWTCPNDGIATMRAATGTSGNKAYWYAKDNTNNVIVGQINQTADGTAMSASFPCIKGHVYTTYAMDQIDTAEVHYYKLTWGGYFLTRFMSTFGHCLERWWSYAEYKENAYEDITLDPTKQENKTDSNVFLWEVDTDIKLHATNRGKHYICITGDKAERRLDNGRHKRLWEYSLRHILRQHVQRDAFRDCRIGHSVYAVTISERGWSVC